MKSLFECSAPLILKSDESHPLVSNLTSDSGNTNDKFDELLLEPGVTAIQASLRDSGGVTFGMVREVADKIVASPYYQRGREPGYDWDLLRC